MTSTLIHNIGLLVGTRPRGHGAAAGHAAAGPFADAAPHAHGAHAAGPLAGAALAHLPSLTDAWLLVTDGRIAAFGQGHPHGPQGGLVATPQGASPLPAVYRQLDASGALVLPSWCDSHTHLVFAGYREGEFVDKIRGLTYAEIAARGGGILRSARLLNETPEDVLYVNAWARLHECMQQGTGAIEIKSGYGLSVEGELKMLRVIRRLKENAPIPVRATFLGAHALPDAYKDDREGYINLIIEKMLPQIAAEGLADYIDVFCEEGFFTQEETERIGRAGETYGLKAKLHANQLHRSGGVQAGVALKALSVDHLETMGQEEIDCLKGSNTIATLLPGAAFFLRMGYPPARAMVDAGLPLALASDYNPGSCPSGNMNLVVSLACIQMRLLPEEAINAATLNGAYAMGLGEEVGSITEGKRANLLFMRPVPSLAYLPYAFGTNCIDRVMVNGEFLLY
ncbi:imidazolonepropionase [Dinghuibacter silviterrae]|uniref:Imidazolonepropionase n=1 Tax=Dinghuibacter silviterrae TaxID=1539049 RepID=A0A4R8DJD2_9BACT|nr:imidazolonepropionase [Dinghuibacter silviterrae]TDW97296.1 imidazolonepropionase [Dinghuibacter silviterrae]